MSNIESIIRNFKLDVKAIEPVTDSFSSTVRKVILNNGSKVVLKVPYSKEKLRREIYFLNKLKGRVPVPNVLDIWLGDDEQIGAILMEYVPGQTINKAIDARLAYEIGISLAKLHSVEFEEIEYGIHRSNKSLQEKEWKTYIYDRIESYKKSCIGMMEAHTYNKCMKLFEKFYFQFTMEADPCIIHRDYRLGNIIMDESHISIIDFESAMSGALENDFVKIKQEVWDNYVGTKKEFLNGYNSIKKLNKIDDMLLFYSFYDAFGSIAWFVDRGKKHWAFYKKNMEFILESVKYYC